MKWTNQTHHYMDVFDFSDSHIHRVVHRQAEVEQKILVGHTSQLHEGNGVAVIKAALVFVGLQEQRLSGFTPNAFKRRHARLPSRRQACT